MTSIDAQPWERTSIDLWEHQRNGVTFCHDKRAAMLFMRMRTGKTRTTCALADVWDSCTVIAIIPKSVDGVWRDHVREFLPHDFINLAHGSIAKRAKRLNEVLTYTPTPVFVVINFEAYWRAPMMRVLEQHQYDLVLFDEIHKLKAPAGKASDAAKTLADRAEHVLGLTGTVMPHSPLDVWGQYRPLDTSVFGASFVRFRAHYAIVKNVPLNNPRRGKYGKLITHYPKVTGFRNQEEMAERMDAITYRVGDLPMETPPTHQRRDVTLSPSAARTYNTLTTIARAKIAAGEITASNALTKLLRLCQITGGNAVTEHGASEVIDTGKHDALVELLQEAGADEPVVVFCRFVHDMDMVHAATSAAFDGEVPCFELSGRSKQLDEFQQHQGGGVLAVQFQAGGIGVDLSRAAIGVFYSNTWSFGDYEQAMYRLLGSNQKRAVAYYHLVAPGTVDEMVYRSLRAKRNATEAVLTHLKAERV